MIAFDNDFGELNQLNQRDNRPVPHGVALFRIPDAIPIAERAELIARNVMAQVDWRNCIWVINIRRRRAI